MADNRQVVFARFPDGPLTADAFEIRHAETPRPGPGELLCRTVLLSIDPANRAWMNGVTYREQQLTGEVMSGYALCEVVDPNGADIPAGSIVSCDAGWQDYAVVPAKEVQVVDRGDEPLEYHMGVLGITGLTAYFGLFDIGKPIPGDTVVVSAASGATGTVAGQLARLAGARVVGITGSDEKNAVLIEQLGFDAAVNRRSESFSDDLGEACPDGVDVYFDNVGGGMLDTMLGRMNLGGRIICCGAVSTYDDPSAQATSQAGLALTVVKRLTLSGFIVLDLVDRWPAARKRLTKLLRSDRLTTMTETIDGLENAPQALIGLLAGENLGKRIVRVGPE